MTATKKLTIKGLSEDIDLLKKKMEIISFLTKKCMFWNRNYWS